MSQTQLAKALNTSTSVIGRYDRDEMTPSVDAAKKIAKTLNTTVGYLLGETDEENLFKDPEMLKRLNEIEKMDAENKTKLGRKIETRNHTNPTVHSRSHHPAALCRCSGT